MGKEKRMTVKLDKRQMADDRRSAFLHRVAYLKVPFAGMTGEGGDFAGTLFREQWELKWDPRTEPALIEQNLYGDTVEAAALSRLQEAMAQAGTNAGPTCARLLDAVNLDLPGLVAAAEGACGTAIDTDPSFPSQATALAALGRLDQYAAFRGISRTRLDELIVRCYDRACFAIPNAVAVPEGEQAGVVAALISVADAVQRDSGRFDRALFADAARNAADATPVPFLRGAFLGLLCEIRELPPGALAAEVASLALASTDVMVTAGDLLDGMLAVSRTSLMLGADALVAAVDDLLKAAEWDPFLVMLPRLRAAVERLSNAQKDSLAATVARRYGLSKADEVRALSGSLSATALVARLDAATAAVLKNWPL